MSVFLFIDLNVTFMHLTQFKFTLYTATHLPGEGGFFLKGGEGIGSGNIDVSRVFRQREETPRSLEWYFRLLPNLLQFFCSFRVFSNNQIQSIHDDALKGVTLAEM